MPDFVVDLDMRVEHPYDTQLAVTVTANDRSEAAEKALILVKKTPGLLAVLDRRTPRNVRSVTLRSVHPDLRSTRRSSICYWRRERSGWARR